MTPEHDPYDAHLRAMGRALHAAPGGHGPRHRTRPLLVAGLAAAVAAALFVLLLGAPGRSPVDVLGRAEAALAPKDELVHYVVRERQVEASSGMHPRAAHDVGCPSTGGTEVWQSPQLDRWRAVMPARPGGPGCGRVTDGRRNKPIRGPVQLAWNDGVLSSYVEENDTLDIVRGYRPDSDARLLPIGDQELGAGDPVAVVRSMLRAGRLRETAKATVRGRRVLVLTGTRDDRDGIRTSIRYAVDAETFVPVRTITSRELRSDAPDGRFQRFWRTMGPQAVQLDFDRYERLPLDEAGRRLLEIHPVRPPDTTDVTEAQLRREIERHIDDVNRQGRANLRRAQRERG